MQKTSLLRWTIGIALGLGLGLVHDSEAAPGRISLDVKDAEIHNVLRLLADVGRVNFVVSDDVKGKLTLKLRNVAWDEVLEVVLRSKGLGAEQQGRVYYVDTLEQLAARAETKLRLEATRKELAPLRTVIIPLAYAKAKDLEPIVRSMLTARGSVQVETRTNSLIVTDVDESTARIERTVR